MALYSDSMWFGNQNHMQWVKAPAINYDSSKRGYASSMSYLNGGVYVRRSSTAAKGYNFTWSMKSRDEIRAVIDYADGVYGDGPIYFLDPFAMDTNLLPQFWAVPALGAGDAPMLIGEFDEQRPGVLPTTPNTLGYPFNTANYSLMGTDVRATVWIPCPAGYSLWFGAHGAATGTAAVQVTPTTGPTSVAPPSALTLLSVNDETRMNFSVNGGTYTGALLSLNGIGTLQLSGLMAQCLPTGYTPQVGGFISGQGHSGCSFVTEPLLTNYSVGINRAGAVVNLVETAGW